MSTKPSLVIFDVNETLFRLDPIGARFAELGLPREAVELWFARLLREAFALGCMDEARPFREIGRVVLHGLLRGRVDDVEDKADYVFGAFEELEPYPEVERTLQMLQEGGVRMVTLTNGHAEVTERLLARCGLKGYIERCLSVDAVGKWKPHPEPYLYAAELCGVAPSQAAMVAVHSWDLAGAKRAGLITGYASRLEGGFVPFYPQPDVSGVDLVDVAKGLLGR